MIGHGLAHVTFGGVALGLFLRIFPLLTALIIAVLASWGIVRLREKAGLHGDIAIGIFSSSGLAFGIILATLAQRFNVDLFGYLFGDILAIGTLEVWLSGGLFGAVLLAVLTNYQALMFRTFDDEAARAAGIKTVRLDLLLTMLTAVTVVLGMKIVGILLVSALLVIPAATALQAAGSFQQALWLSLLVAMSSVVTGLVTAFYLDFPASATIVLIAFLVFLLLMLTGKRGVLRKLLKSKIQRLKDSSRRQNIE